jgi:hypothetical protein
VIGDKWLVWVKNNSFPFSVTKSTWEDWNSSNSNKIINAFDCSRNNRKLELLENNSPYLDLIDKNGNILIQHDEIFSNIAQENDSGR